MVTLAFDHLMSVNLHGAKAVTIDKHPPSASRRPAIQQRANRMYSKILVPVDGSPTSNLGLDEAIKFAKLTGASLKLLNVVDIWALAAAPESFTGVTPELLALLKEGGAATLAAAKARVEAAGLRVDTVLADSLEGRVCDLVTDEATRWGAELIVIGTHGRRGVGRLVLGSDAEQIVRLSPVPVLLVRSKESAPAKK
jgi:nucleotide-binding universal stress UspA family protein